MIKRATIGFLTTATLCSACQAQDIDHSIDGIRVEKLFLGGGDKAFLARDINQDHWIDLTIVQEAESRITVLLNDKGDGFDVPIHYEAGSNPTSLTSLDFNGDGHADLAIANHETDTVTLLAGDGDGGFTPPEYSPLPIITEPHSHVIEAEDFNNDGFTDLIVDSRDRLGAFILEGRPSGSFDAPGQGIDVGGTPYLGFAIGDINNDAAPDLATPNANNISILLNRSAREIGFEQAASVDIEAPFAVALGDFNGDGDTDLVVANDEQNGGVTVLAGDSEGNFDALTSFSIAAGANTIATGDANGDGLLDIVITSWNADLLLVLGGATLSPQRLPVDGIENPWSAAFGDFDGDGRDEIVVGDASSRLVNVYSLDTAN